MKVFEVGLINKKHLKSKGITVDFGNVNEHSPISYN